MVTGISQFSGAHMTRPGVLLRNLVGIFLEVLATRITATSKAQIASDCNRNSTCSLRLRKGPMKPTLWTDIAISEEKACDFEVVIANH